MKKILVLGSAGFVGKSLMNLLKENKSHDIMRVDGKSTLDLRTFSDVEYLIHDFCPDIVFNLACHVGSLHYVTEFAADVYNDNMRMNLNLYAAVKKYAPKCTIVNPLANCAYPSGLSVQKEEDLFSGPVHPSVFSFGNIKRSLYALSKSYESQYGIKSINLIFPNAFGPGDSTDPKKAHAINGIILRMLEAKKRQDSFFEIWGTGKPVREWIYVEDFARILLESISKKWINGSLIEPVNVAQNVGYSIKDSTKLISKIVGFNGGLKYNTEYQDGCLKKIMSDEKFRVLFPDFVFSSHHQGLEETVKYYEEIL